jgi:hypothetical protein
MRVEAEGPRTGRRRSAVKREAGKRVEHVLNMQAAFGSAVKRNR